MAETGAISASRRLLQRLRDLMASTGDVQERLDQVVRLIAGNMVAEVCSVYVMRAGEVLELFASEGLKAEAVHLTRLQIGEGIVGDIAARARPLALSDAQSHPNFAYRPETGEEVYQSLMGVPILRGGRVMGVLVIQNRTRRAYTEEEVETLQTIAMVLAELVAGGELVSPDELGPGGAHPLSPMRLTGVAFNQGLAIGRAVMHQPRAVAHRLVAEDAEIELVCEDELPEVEADKDRLHQVMTNLIGNACKFLPEKGGKVRVSAERAGRYVLFRVEDSGQGVPFDHWDLVFEKFKQVGDTLTEKPQGTGLGLPICRKILTSMKGRIWCDASSDLGGAQFSFTLPICDRESAVW